MEAYLLEWSGILLRWLHVIAAVAWIGASFYFVWLDNSLAAPTDPALRKKGVGGELWAVHGGGFYNPQKYLVAPATVPAHLHWFYWEAYTTWLSGFVLFSAQYLFNANTFLIDKDVMAMTAPVAVASALAFLAVGWIVYDLICRMFGDREDGDRIVGILIVVYVIAAVWLVCHVFAGRAAFLLAGAMVATIMVANVLFWVIPGQRKMVASMRAGQAPDPIHGRRGKQRSVHNSYFTLPVVFAMLSNHYSMMYGAANNWLILLLMMLAGVLIRHFFILRHKAVVHWRYPAAALLVFIVVGVMLAPAPAPAAADAGVPFARIEQIVDTRCLQCHAAKPTLMPTPGKNIVLDSKDGIGRHAQQIYQQVVVQKSMPLGNLTKITDEERALIGAWFTAGAATK
ncbi:MAG: rane protein [Herbaspirillum sp.]|nr:rane protein [Herbaspirillum sp.]